MVDLVFDDEDGAFESPLAAGDVVLARGAASAVAAIQDAGWEVVVVSNQPAMAKGKVGPAQLVEVHEEVVRALKDEGVEIESWRYCFHHPQALVDEFRAQCNCRKPEPGLITETAKDMSIELPSSWMIGDSDTDVQAGKAAGCRTVLIEAPGSEHRRGGNSYPDWRSSSLQEAVQLLPGLGFDVGAAGTRADD